MYFVVLEASRMMKETDAVAIVEKPIRSFGIITDIHYGDLDDRWNYSRTFRRHYRNSLKLVRQANQFWLNGKNSIDFVLQLGDLIDGFCQSNGTSEKDLETILNEFLKIPIYHIWGNHEFYNFSREKLLNGPLRSFDTQNISPSHYGVIDVTENLRILALDTYDFSILGYENDSETYVEALKYLRQFNKNENLSDRIGLNGDEQRFVPWNGAVSKKQLSWLREQLEEAEQRKQKVLLIGHVPLHLLAGDESAIVWNNRQVFDILWSFDNLVLAYIAGHAHEGGYFRDEKNIHHLTLPAVVECEHDTNSFATVHVYQHYLLIEGYGRVGTYRLDYQC